MDRKKDQLGLKYFKKRADTSTTEKETMANIINRLIGEEIDTYKDIYDFQLSQLKTGLNTPAAKLVSNAPDYTYYRMLDTMSYFQDFKILHDYKSDRRHFVESEFQYVPIRRRIKIPLFYTETVQIEYIFKKESVLLFEGKVVDAFKVSAQLFIDLLSRNKNKGTIKVTLVEFGDRKQFESGFFGESLDIIPHLELEAKRNLIDFLSDPTYRDARNRLKLFYPGLSAKDIIKMDKTQIQNKVDAINFKSLGIKTTDAYLYFFNTFSKYYITNSQLMKKTRYIDEFLSKYLDK